MKTVTEGPGPACLVLSVTRLRRGPTWIQRLREILPSAALWRHVGLWMEGQRAEQVSSLRLSVPGCMMGASGGIVHGSEGEDVLPIPHSPAVPAFQQSG